MVDAVELLVFAEGARHLIPCFDESKESDDIFPTLSLGEIV